MIHLPIQLSILGVIGLSITTSKLGSDDVSVFLLLVRIVSFFHRDCAVNKVAKTQDVVVHDANSVCDRLLLEEDDESFAFEISLLVLVHCDPWLAIGTPVDNAKLLERILELSLGCV